MTNPVNAAFAVAAIVPAAGRGSRMGAEIPKQYLSVCGQTILEHSLQALLRQPEIQRVYVALAADDLHFDSLSVSNDPRVVRVTGGDERADSVLSALRALVADGFDWALVHDAARPCLKAADVQRLMDDCARYGRGALLACAARDTMKRADAQGTVAETVCRNGLWHALTPQLFPAALLASAIAGAQAAGVAVTDEASAMEWAGHPVGLVPGSRWNQKITEPDDLALATAWLSGAFEETQ